MGEAKRKTYTAAFKDRGSFRAAPGRRIWSNQRSSNLGENCLGYGVQLTVPSNGVRTAYCVGDRERRRAPVITSRWTAWWRHAIRCCFAVSPALWQAIRAFEPDVVISFVHMVNIRVILALWDLDFSMIVTEHTDPGRSQLGMSWRSVRRLVYPRATRLVSVGWGADPGFAWLAGNRRQVICNPIRLPPLQTARSS